MLFSTQALYSVLLIKSTILLQTSNQKTESIEENAVTYGGCSQADTCLLCHADQRSGL